MEKRYIPKVTLQLCQLFLTHVIHVTPNNWIFILLILILNFIFEFYFYFVLKVCYDIFLLLTFYLNY